MAVGRGVLHMCIFKVLIELHATLAHGLVYAREYYRNAYGIGMGSISLQAARMGFSIYPYKVSACLVARLTAVRKMFSPPFVAAPIAEKDHEAASTAGPNRHGSGRSWYADTTVHGGRRGREVRAGSDGNAGAGRTRSG